MNSPHKLHSKLPVLVALYTWVLLLVAVGRDKLLSCLFDNWEVTITMVFGSIIAGGTAEGGGAVSFPVFTKLLHIPPYDAKVFALLIQSIGMSAASLLIFIGGIPVERRVLLWASSGGVIGITCGVFAFSPLLVPNITKMTFTVLQAGFAVVLIVMNRRVRTRNNSLPICGLKERMILFLSGALGGVLSGLVGTGLDIVVFSVMVLLFRMNEKVATPTSVVLMATNAIVGAFIYQFILQGVTDSVRGYWIASVPVVVVGAPLGALICSILSREAIVKMLLVLILIEVVTSLMLIPLNLAIICYSLSGLMLFLLVFYWMYQNKTYQREGWIY